MGHLLWGGLGLYLLARGQGLGRWPATVAAGDVPGLALLAGPGLRRPRSPRLGGLLVPLGLLGLRGAPSRARSRLAGPAAHPGLDVPYRPSPGMVPAGDRAVALGRLRCRELLARGSTGEGASSGISGRLGGNPGGLHRHGRRRDRSRLPRFFPGSRSAPRGKGLRPPPRAISFTSSTRFSSSLRERWEGPTTTSATTTTGNRSSLSASSRSSWSGQGPCCPATGRRSGAGW